ncbi:MAG: GNAT family N-acetyltransferase [Armatimonadetes bacterium]|nr:GNAT family N-acetyltransferase [Armatimonadota bacterium]
MPAFLNLPLETERLTLRPARLDDASAFFEFLSDLETVRYWWSPPAKDVSEIERQVQRAIDGLAANQWLDLSIVHRETGDTLGKCSLFAFFEQCRRAEMGYLLGRPFWGHGYMAEATAELIRYGFENLDLHRIEADIDPRNRPSARVLERNGFQQEGLLRERWIVGEEVSDTAYYGLLRKDWEAARQSAVA